MENRFCIELRTTDPAVVRAALLRLARYVARYGASVSMPARDRDGEQVGWAATVGGDFAWPADAGTFPVEPTHYEPDARRTTIVGGLDSQGDDSTC